MKNQFILLLVVISVFIGCRDTSEHADSTLFYAGCQSLLDSIYSANPTSVGIMVHIESPNHSLSWSGCSGYADRDQRLKVTYDQPALIASCMKTYVSASMLRLQELDLLTIEDPISLHLTERTIVLFEEDGYDFDSICIKHLLSHTSGIKGYEDRKYLERIDRNRKYRWTRDEQLELTVAKGDPLGVPEDVWSYADANFLLCTEIIESAAQKPFYTAIGDLLKFDELGFTDTWFPTLEKPSAMTRSLVHQYWSSWNWDSHEHDISWDLYGGGGLAATTEELAGFYYHLFQGNIIKDSTVLTKIFTKIVPSNGEDTEYYLGLGEGISNGYKYYFHGGFWGTTVRYLPELESSIAVYVLEKDKSVLVEQVGNAMVTRLAKQVDVK